MRQLRAHILDAIRGKTIHNSSIIVVIVTMYLGGPVPECPKYCQQTIAIGIDGALSAATPPWKSDNSYKWAV